MLLIGKVLAASQTDINIFANTRLSSVPFGSTIQIECQAHGGSGATLKLQNPTGDVPTEPDGIAVPTGDTEGEIDDRKKLAFRYNVGQGSNPVALLTTPAATTVAYRAALL